MQSISAHACGVCVGLSRDDNGGSPAITRCPQAEMGLPSEVPSSWRPVIISNASAPNCNFGSEACLEILFIVDAG